MSTFSGICHNTYVQSLTRSYAMHCAEKYRNELYIFLCQHMESSRSSGPVSHTFAVYARYLLFALVYGVNASYRGNVLRYLSCPHAAIFQATEHRLGVFWSLLLISELPGSILYPKAGYIEIFGEIPQSFPTNVSSLSVSVCHSQSSSDVI
jgi:hypothetical protein